MLAASPLTGIFMVQLSFRAPEHLSVFLKLERIISTNAKIPVRTRSVRFMADLYNTSNKVQIQKL